MVIEKKAFYLNELRKNPSGPFNDFMPCASASPVIRQGITFTFNMTADQLSPAIANP